MISSSQRPLPDNTQHSQQTNIHAPGGIRTHDRSRRAAVDLPLRLRGYWNRLKGDSSNRNKSRRYSCLYTELRTALWRRMGEWSIGPVIVSSFDVGSAARTGCFTPEEDLPVRFVLKFIWDPDPVFTCRTKENTGISWPVWEASPISSVVQPEKKSVAQEDDVWTIIILINDVTFMMDFNSHSSINSTTQCNGSSFPVISKLRNFRYFRHCSSGWYCTTAPFLTKKCRPRCTVRSVSI